MSTRSRRGVQAYAPISGGGMQVDPLAALVVVDRLRQVSCDLEGSNPLLRCLLHGKD